VRVGATILVLLSRGNLCEVPQVTGKSTDVAETLLNNAGFAMRVDPWPSDEPAGTILTQQPEAGEKFDCGEKVALLASTGPGEPTTTPSGGNGG
jgi:serine/threonine-protein kinase